MTGPIVGNGRLIGTLNFARIGITSAFSDRDLSNLGAVCLHVSACLASLRQQNNSENSFSLVERENSQISLLTKREIQVVDLVARGLTNAEIGKELWISHNTVKQALKTVFRKLEVSSRVEMIAKILKAKE
ncbi:response regulator transcription factor [Waterburya agarophytonicola]|nr:helix-turn-helix transcriptional regulator [Waterburya agarophytonicola]